MRPIQYIDYDKLSDNVLYLGSRLYLRMNVSLSQKADPNQRYHFHKEYKYDSLYSSSKKLLSIRRSFDYYLSFDKVDTKDIIIIRPQDMILLKMKLESVSKWFSDDTFGSRGKELVIRKKKDPIVLSGLSYQQYLKFEPVPIVWETTGEQTPGVRITLGDSSSFADISVDKFFGLMYTISTFNMYESAQILINYLGRPDFGFNLYEFDNMDILEQEEPEISAKINRQLPKQNASFFEKMNKMNDQ